MEIRRIHEHEGDAVAGLWDRMCRDSADGGPLTERGRRNIARMLAMSAWHHSTFCLVAVVDEHVVGFAQCRVDPGDGLLPGAVGAIDTLYVIPEARGEGVSTALVDAAVAHLRDRGASTVRTLACVDDAHARLFWQDRGFAADMVALSLYESS